MLSLKYPVGQCGPQYQFELYSDHECSFETHNLNIAAFDKKCFPTGFTHISYENVNSYRFILGSIKAKRTQEGFLRANISFAKLDYDPLEKNKILSNSELCIILVSGILSTFSILNVHAHFEVQINTPSSDSMCIADEFKSLDSLSLENNFMINHFNTKTFMIVEENPIVVLPKKRKPRPRIRANIKGTKGTNSNNVEKKATTSTKKEEQNTANMTTIDENNKHTLINDVHYIGGVGGSVYNGYSSFTSPGSQGHQNSSNTVQLPTATSMTTQQQPTQSHFAVPAAIPVIMPMSMPMPNTNTNTNTTMLTNSGRHRAGTFVATTTTTTTMTTTTTSVMPVKNPDLFFGYIFEDNEVILPMK